MQYLAQKKDELVTAKQMAEDLQVSFEFLAKTLQTLKRKGLVNTIQGMKGGYALCKDASEITLMDIIVSLEKHPEIVECGPESDHDNCDRKDFCTIRHPMMIIQEKIDTIFNSTYLSEFISEKKVVELTF
jgi:Rrf2 family protein